MTVAVPRADLLTTKITPPPLPRTCVVRPSLSRRFSEPGAVILLSAPPGYGKTTALAAWLAAADLATAWLSLDASDNDPALFLAYLGAAIRHGGIALDPSVGPAPGSLPVSVASLTPLLNALDDAARPILIVLDDYQVIEEPAVHELVGFLARRLPANARLAIGTRQDPPLPLSRLRAHGQLVEIRADDLRFGPAEAGAFLSSGMGVELAAASVERLTERTEGWVAGLQLAALSLRSSADPESFVAEFGASDRYVVEYLTEEALARQTAEVRSFLEVTCVLDRLTGSLCDALTGSADGAGLLERLAEANLFVTPLDERRGWYRYHRLFADLIAAGLDPARRSELHTRAAAWFEGHGEPRAAVGHYLEAGELAAAARLIDRIADETFAYGEFGTILAWSRALPCEPAATLPRLGVLAAWAEFLLGHFASSQRSLERLRGLDLRGDGRAIGRLRCLEAWFANRRDDPAAESIARAAITALPATDSAFRSLAYTTLGESLVGADAPAAMRAFLEANRLAAAFGHSAVQLGTIYSLAITELVLGRRAEAEARCRRALEDLSDAHGASLPALGMVHLPLAVALFEADELQLARQHFALGQELCRRAGLAVTMLGGAEWQEILTLHALGEREEAWRRLRGVRAEAERHRIARVAFGMELLAAELALRERDAVAARRTLDKVGSATDRVFGGARDRGREVLARVLLAEGRAEEGLAVLGTLAADQRAGGRVGRLLVTLVLRAAALERVGQMREASRALAEAIALGAPQGIRHVFVDPTLSLERILARTADADPAFVASILEARRATTTSPVIASKPATSPDRPLIEPLSVRELEVLRLVSAGLTNEEIGRELYLSTGTAKWHVHNVLGKLGARNRAALIARARSLGLA